MLASDERGPTDPNELSPVSYWPSPSVSDQVKTLMKLESSPNPRGLPCPAASPASVSVSRREFSWSSLFFTTNLIVLAPDISHGVMRAGDRVSATAKLLSFTSAATKWLLT